MFSVGSPGSRAKKSPGATGDRRRSPARARMVRSAATLMRERGIHGVGLREIVTHSGGPRGLLGRYFPGGKTQLMSEAIDVALAGLYDELERTLTEAETFPDAIGLIVAPWRRVLVDHEFALGCPLAATVVDAADNDELTSALGSGIAKRWQACSLPWVRRALYGARSTASFPALLLVFLPADSVAAEHDRGFERQRVTHRQPGAQSRGHADRIRASRLDAPVVAGSLRLTPPLRRSRGATAHRVEAVRPSDHDRSARASEHAVEDAAGGEGGSAESGGRSRMGIPSRWATMPTSVPWQITERRTTTKTTP